MRIGILSDSHGRAPITERAARLLIDHGSELLVHLGDICGEAVIDALVHRQSDDGQPDPPVRLVFGNCDYDAQGLADYARALGVRVDHPMGWIDAAGKAIAFTHGDRPELMQAALDDGVDYLLHGHTHHVRDQFIGRTRIINPGALYRANRHTVALLESMHGGLMVLDVI